jgi:hypothetical protein
MNLRGVFGAFIAQMNLRLLRCAVAHLYPFKHVRY